MQPRHHCTDEKWLKTSNGDPRGYIDPLPLKELWFHMGTVCNLRCPDCYENSAPGDHRLEMVTFDEIKPFIDEAVELGVEQFSFTGGEPFVTKDIVRILEHTLDFCPCLMLTNGVLQSRIDEVFPMVEKKHPLSFRVSLDYPDVEKHDALRGGGMFQRALETLSELYSAGFHVSVARRRIEGENASAVDAAYRPLFEAVDLPEETQIISFPNLTVPAEASAKEGQTGTPEITETCMTTYHTEETRAKFMCAFSRMIVKQNGNLRVYACTLVDDNPFFDLGGSLAETADVRVMLEHSRCYSCFAGGTSCSELM